MDRQAQIQPFHIAVVLYTSWRRQHKNSKISIYGELTVVSCILLFQFLVLWSQVKGCVKLLKEQPAARSEGLLNALRWVKYLFVERILVPNELMLKTRLLFATATTSFSFCQLLLNRSSCDESLFCYSFFSHKHLSCICIYSFPAFFCISVSLGISILSLVFRVQYLQFLNSQHKIIAYT